MSRPDQPDLLSALAHFLGTTPEALAGQDADAMRARLDRVRLTLGKLMAAAATGSAEPADASGLPADIAALRDALAQVGIGPGDATRREPGGIDVAGLEQRLGALVQGMEARQPGSGKQVDTVIAELEKLFGGAGARREAETDERIRGDARSAIAERLRQAGIKPSGDS